MARPNLLPFVVQPVNCKEKNTDNDKSDEKNINSSLKS